MTDFLSSLVDRSFGATAAIRPRLAFLFEPAFPHGEPAADVAHLREADAASGAPEREPARPVVDRRDEPASERRLTYRPESGEHATRGPAAVPAPHPGAAEAPPPPAPARQTARVPVEEGTNRPRREPAAHDSRQDEAAQVAPRRDASTAIRSADSVRPEPAETAAVQNHAERGLLVPSKVGARIAANLQSTVSAASLTSRDRGPGPQRGAESHHAQPERNVHVTIGRIEVRATAGEKTPARERPASSVMGLDEYLRRQARRGGQ